MATGARKAQLGQFFTTDPTVQRVMCDLVTHTTGSALEPSAGEGHLAGALAAARPDLLIDAIELDTELVWAPPTVQLTLGDFFTTTDKRDGTYDVVFGNPPYVAWKSVDDTTRTSAAATKRAYTDKANLYHLFIDRSVDLLADGGELVFIVPAEWLYTTSAKPLRAKLLAHGAITDLIHCGEAKLFADASVPAIVIFKYVKGPAQTAVRYADSLEGWTAGDQTMRTLLSGNDRWMLAEPATAEQITGWGRLGDSFDVRVGLVSGCDRIYRLDDTHDIEPDCVSEQVTTRKRIEPFLWCEAFDSTDDIPAHARALLDTHRDTLAHRRIKTFDDTNWWKWGAVRNEAHMASSTERFFALAKTRDRAPFFTVPGGTYFGGGVLGLFRKPGAVDIATAVAVCNHPLFRKLLEAMFLTTGDKVSFQPATLADVPFPATVEQAHRLLTDARSDAGPQGDQPAAA